MAERRSRGAGRTLRGIDELAALVGAYCWVERRIFQIAGAWACSPDDAPAAPGDRAHDELRVWCAALSRRHGSLAGCWAERLPVRAGVDPDGLVAPPAGPLPAALAVLAGEHDTVTGVTVLAAAAAARACAACTGATWPPPHA